MPADRFRLETEPAQREAREGRARQRFVERIRERHEERDRKAAKEPDNDAFRARAWLVMAAEELVDAFDPLDGATFDQVLEQLTSRFDGSRQRYFNDTDLAVYRDRRLVAVIRRGPRGQPLVTRF